MSRPLLGIGYAPIVERTAQLIQREWAENGTKVLTNQEALLLVCWFMLIGPQRVHDGTYLLAGLYLSQREVEQLQTIAGAVKKAA